MNEPTLYEQMGGARTFAALVGGFYQRVADDADLRPMYPEEDLTGAETRLRMFLEQYWGGPHTYQEVRGHPRLRLRHAPFVIDPDQRDRWLGHMAASLADIPVDQLPNPLRQQLWDYLTAAAHAMVNTMPGVEPPT